MSARKAFAKFQRRLLTASTFGVGIAWDERHGWRPYQQADGFHLFVSPNIGRQIVRRIQEEGARPHNASAYAALKEIFDDLAKICDEADARNAAKEIPPDGLKFMRPGGQA